MLWEADFFKGWELSDAIDYVRARGGLEGGRNDPILGKLRRRRCAHCGARADPRASHYRLCGGCMKRRYSSLACQEANWDQVHSRLCPILRAEEWRRPWPSGE